MDQLNFHWLDSEKQSLASKIFDQGVHFRILFLGISVNGSTDPVSCLSRALRNLGHHLLDIDLVKHSGFTEKSKHLTSGNISSFLKTTAIDHLCAIFCPQLIICCSSGVTFHTEHAIKLKKSGIILIGITLNDLENTTSISSHNQIFDFHTTNLRPALEIYHNSGCYNTLYLPFGCDRNFITQTISDTPELRCDVIMMDQVASRTEYESIIKILSKKYSVNSYDNDLNFQNSDQMTGIRKIQALRSAKASINFPMTKAGFNKINSNVFDSIGSGTLFFTRRFSEMADLFQYGSEIIGYENENELAEQLDLIFKSPQLFQQITHSALMRVANEHLYEHRWMTLLDKVFNCSLDTTPWLDESQIQRIRKTLSRSLPRAKHIILSGFYGANNIGDELILRAIQSELVRFDPSVQVIVAAENPVNVEFNHGLQAFTRKNLIESQHHARTASAIVVGGGGLWHDYTFDQSLGLLGIFQEPQVSMAGYSILPILGHIFEIPCHVVGLGVGPIKNSDAFRMLKFVAELADTVYVRDHESLALLDQAGVTKHKIFMAPDVVFALDLPEVKTSESLTQLKVAGYTVVGINLRPWSKFDEPEFLTRLASVFQSINRKEKLLIVTIPMQAGANFDELTLSKFETACGKDLKCIHLKSPLTLEDLVKTLQACDVLVSMRLHACLLAHRLRKPVIGFAYDPKVEYHFHQIGRTDFSLPLDASFSDIENLLHKGLSEQGFLPDNINNTLLTLESQAREAIKISVRKISTINQKSAVFEIPIEVETLRQSNSRLAQKSVNSYNHSLFKEFKVNGTGFEPEKVNSAFHLSATQISLNLPTDFPKMGDSMFCDGNFIIDPECAEINLLLKTNYIRQNSSGYIHIHLQIGNFLLTEDLYHDEGTIRIHFGIPESHSSLPLRLDLTVLKSTFMSVAWPRVTRITLDINNKSFTSGPRTRSGYLLSSRGIISKINLP